MGFYRDMAAQQEQNRRDAEDRAVERQKAAQEPQLIAGPYAPMTPQQFAAQSQQSLQNNQFAHQQALSSQEAQQGLTRQLWGADLQNQLGHNQAAQQAEIQQKRDFTQHQYGMESQTHGADLQARLSEVQLGQQEQMRLQRLKQAKESVNANPDLSPEEKRMLGTQIESGLNPLENRQREAQMLHQTIQSHALVQQTQQQATIFNQRQQALARGIAGNIQTLTDPETGITQQFFVDQDGRPTPMDYAQSRQLHELRMTTGQVGIAGQVQGIQQSAASFPQRQELLAHNVRHAGLTNEQLGEQISQSRMMNPLQLESVRGEIDYRRQQLESERQRMQNAGEAFPLEQQQRLRHLEQMSQAITHASTMNPLTEQGADLRNQHIRQELEQNPQLFEQNLQLLQQRVSQGPQAFRTHEEYQQAQTDMVRAHTAVYQNQATRDARENSITPQVLAGINARVRHEVNDELRRAQNPGNHPQTRAPLPIGAGPSWLRIAGPDGGQFGGNMQTMTDHDIRLFQDREIERRTSQAVQDIIRGRGGNAGQLGTQQGGAMRGFVVPGAAPTGGAGGVPLQQGQAPPQAQPQGIREIPPPQRGVGDLAHELGIVNPIVPPAQAQMQANQGQANAGEAADREAIVSHLMQTGPGLSDGPMTREQAEAWYNRSSPAVRAIILSRARRR